MQVYVELSLIENFCMDFTLMYAAKTATKTPSSRARLVVSSACGACFAVAYPLIELPQAAGIAIKLLSALLLCAVSARVKSVKAYLKYTAAFYLFSAIAAGLIFSVFTVSGLEFVEGGGFLLSEIPVGIPLFFALCVAVFAKRLAARLKKNYKNSVICRIYAGEFLNSP